MNYRRRSFPLLSIAAGLIGATIVSAGVNCSVSVNPMVLRLSGQTEKSR